MIECRISAATTVRSGSFVGVGEQAVEGALGEEERVLLVVGAVDRHPDVVQEGAAGDDHLGVAVAHPVVGDHRRLDPRFDQQAQQAQGDVEDDLHVDPAVVRHAEPLGVDLGHVPPGAHLVVGVDRVEEALEPPVAARRRAHVRLGDRLCAAACGRGPRGRGPGSAPRALHHPAIVGDVRARTSALGPRRSAADRPGTRAGPRVEERRAVVLLGFGGRGGVATAADRFPGPLVELVFAAVGAVGGDRFRVAAGLAGARSLRASPSRRRRAAGEPFASLAAALAPAARRGSDRRRRGRPGEAQVGLAQRRSAATRAPAIAGAPLGARAPAPPVPSAASAAAGEASAARIRRRYMCVL